MMNFEGSSKRVNWPILRVDPGHSPRVILHADRLLMLQTHWVSKSVLCLGDETCPLCDLCCSRPLWYMPVKVVSHNRFAIAELSAHGASDLEMVCRFSGNTEYAGCELIMSRRGSRRPIRCEFLERHADVAPMDDCLWVSALMAIYQLPELRDGERVHEYANRIQSMVHTRAELAANSLRSVGSN